MPGIALIGCGYWGPVVARSIELTERAKVHWLCDQDEGRAKALQRKYPAAKATASLAEVLKDPDVTAVVVSTPVSTHCAIAKQVLEAGKHVLVEKPITLTPGECESLITVAQQAKKVLMVGHVFEYNNSIQALKSIIKSGDLGDLHYIQSERTNLGPVRTDVNALMDLATHDISILIELTGRVPQQVSANGHDYLNSGVEDVVFCNYTFADGLLANVHASWLNPRKVRQITVVGSRKMAVWDDLDLKTPIKIYDKHVEMKAVSGSADSFLAYKTAVVDGGLFIPNIQLNEPLLSEIQHFLDCIDKDLTPRSDGFSGYRVMKILEATSASIKQGGASVSIDVGLAKTLQSVA